MKKIGTFFMMLSVVCMIIAIIAKEMGNSELAITEVVGGIWFIGMANFCMLYEDSK